MKRLIFLLLVFIPLLLTAQVTKERRVYYLDCTGTMKTNKAPDGTPLNKKVCTNLKNAINSVNDETTELIVIPFWDDKPIKKVFKQDATEEGKEKLCKEIDNLAFNGPTTALNIPLEDFCNGRVDNNRITYMFLLTDGKNEKQQAEYENNLRKWGQQFGDKQVYGFYVMLCDVAKNKKVEDIINQQSHLWKVETADINLNIIRLNTKAIFNVRDDKYVDIPILSGKLDGVTFEAHLADNTYYHTTKTEKVGEKLRVWLEPSQGQTTATLPEETKVDLCVNIKVNDKFTFLVTDIVTLTCYNKKQYTLKVSVKP